MRDIKRIDPFLEELKNNMEVLGCYSLPKLLEEINTQYTYYTEDEKMLNIIKGITNITSSGDTEKDDLDNLLTIIKRIWKAYPDFRFAQLIGNIIEPNYIGTLNNYNLAATLYNYYKKLLGDI